MANTIPVFVAVMVMTSLTGPYFFSDAANTTLLCSVCKCSSSTEDSPYYVDCKSKALSEIPTWDLLFDDGHAQVLNVHLLMGSNMLMQVVSFEGRHCLTHIDFDSNSINRVEPQAFQFLDSLRYLSLAHNNLSTIHRDAFRAAEGRHLPIEILNLTGNNLQHLDDDLFQDLPALFSLDLSGNPFKTLDSSTITALNGLQALGILNLAVTSLSNLPEQLVNPINHLDVLILSDNKMEMVPDVLVGASQLVKLDLDGNPIKTLEANSFLGLGALQELNISNMPNLEFIGPNAFGPLQSLRVLRCSNNPELTSIDPFAFRDLNGRTLQNLDTVDMHLNALHHVDRRVFERIELSVVNLQRNPFNCTCMLAWLKNQKIADEYKEELRCVTPDVVSGQRIEEVDFKTLPCPTPKQDMRTSFSLHIRGVSYNPYVGVIAGLAVLCVISLLATVVILRRKSIMSRLGPKSEVRYIKARNFDSIPIDA